MHQPLNIPFPGGIAKLLTREELERSAAWPNAFRDNCKDHRFYEIVEQTLGSEFEHHYVVLEDERGIVRAVQPIFIVQQNLVEGVPGRLRSAVDFVRRRFPRFLTMRVLMVGCVAGEGHLGACAAEDKEWVAEALHSSLNRYARRFGASLVVLKDFPARYRESLRSFSNNGYARVPSMPMTRLSLGYTDFDEYVATLGASTRKDLRRKLRKIAKAPPIELEVVNDIAPQIDEVYPLYLQVHERSKMKFERLTKQYFCDLGKRMPERTRFFVWRQLGKAIAFSLCMVYGDTVYDEYLGLDYNVALDLHLYFYTLRDIISWTLEQGISYYCSSPLNYQPKLHLGCDLLPLDLYVMHTGLFVNPIFRRAVKLLGPTRHDPVLQKFPNADQL
jgi:predicted N-acyltransferase